MATNIFNSKVTVNDFDEVALEEGFSPLTTIHKYTLSNGVMEVDVIDYGATITAIRVPDKDGNMADIVLGYDNMKGYMATTNNPYFGATIGRVANRIANGKFTLDKVTYVLSRNEDDKTLHGGVVGFNRRLWRACIDNEGLSLHLTSPHLDQGFPGELKVKAKFILTRSNRLVIQYTAITDRPTIINMTHHGYFNLAGHDAGAEKLYEHNLMIDANNFTPNDENNIPKGKIQDVLHTVLDFTKSKNIGQAIGNTAEANGFDINFCVNSFSEKRLVASLEHPGTGRRMVVYSNQPGVQLYTGNCVEVKEGRGKGGVGYTRHAALCLETQNYPNAINEKHFPSCLLKPLDKYIHIVSYEFSTFDEQGSTLEDESTVGSKSLNEQLDFYSNEDSHSEKRSLSEKTGKIECSRDVDSQTDTKECLTQDVFPNFTVGIKRSDSSLNYEPMSSIFASESEADQKKTFDNELKQCWDVLGLDTSSPRLKAISPSNVLKAQYNILTSTDLTLTRNLSN